jgi:hypothetical protein
MLPWAAPLPRRQIREGEYFLLLPGSDLIGHHKLTSELVYVSLSPAYVLVLYSTRGPSMPLYVVS